MLNVRYRITRAAPFRWRLARQVPTTTGGETTVTYTLDYFPTWDLALDAAVRYADEARRLR
jgi:hypothetical protein